MSTIANYTGYGWQGEKYDGSLDITEIAKRVKQAVKKAFPNIKLSIRIERYSQGQSMDISLMEAPFDVFDNNEERMLNSLFYRLEPTTAKRIENFKSSHGRNYAQLNPYALNEHDFKNGNNGVLLTKEAHAVLTAIYQLVSAYNFDDSDSMIDYFHTNFYVHMNIGKWDKPFKKTDKA